MGRVAIPKQIREALGIQKGDMVTVAVEKFIPKKRRRVGGVPSTAELVSKRHTQALYRIGVAERSQA